MFDRKKNIGTTYLEKLGIISFRRAVTCQSPENEKEFNCLAGKRGNSPEY